MLAEQEVGGTRSRLWIATDEDDEEGRSEDEESRFDSLGCEYRTKYVYDPARTDLPATLRIEAPTGWRISVPLDPDPSDPAAWVAPDFDALADAPVEVGPSETVDGTAADRPFSLAIWGDARFDRAALVGDVAKIIAAEAAVFEGLPYDRYLFILHLAVGARGGLEHMRSSVCGTSPHAFATRTGVLDLLSLLAHEHFHAWNVKRIRPAGLSPYRYGEENYTRLLWIAEGGTAYYDWHVLVRAGLATRAEYLRHLADRIAQLEATPGRLVQSLEEASFDAWVKLYRPDESSANVTVSYYLKGEVVWAMLDLELRARSGGRAGTDDVMRALWKSGRPVPEDAREIFCDVAGTNVADLFDRYARGRGEVDVDAHLRLAGLRLVRERKAGAPAVALGVRLATSNGRTTLLGVDRGSPAEAAGLSPGDEILALDGMRVDDAGLRERLGARAPGDEAKLTVFRRDRLTDVVVRLGEAPKDDYRIEPDPEASAEARALCDAWLRGAKE